MNSEKRQFTLAILLIVLIAVVLVACTWANYQYCSQNPGGNDFLVHWMGTRKYVLQNVSPYSDETALAIQNFAYGHPAQSGEHELRVAYPLYSIIFFLPFAIIPKFAIARALWMTLLEAALMGVCNIFGKTGRLENKPGTVGAFYSLCYVVVPLFKTIDQRECCDFGHLFVLRRFFGHQESGG